MLGDPYGVVLERGELQLSLAEGAFTVHYYQTPLPIAPPTYPLILTPALERLGDLEEEDPARLELASIITSCQRLPGPTTTDPEELAERRREQIVIKRRIADLMAASPEAAAAIDASVTEINGDPEQTDSFNALDQLLDAQSYRLSSFRTAGEEINYRRFFAINELAAVRQEEREVFVAAHARLLQLLGDGAITGLRIDHPDGLWDPAGYYRDLQRAAYCTLSNTPDDEEPDWDAIDPALGDLWEGQSGDGAEIAASLPLYVVVEKILEPGEGLPQDWAVHGTVGYEFARATTGLFVDPATRRAFDQLYTRFTGERRTFAAIAYETRDLMLRTALASETNVLARALNRISEQNRRTRDFTLSSLRTRPARSDRQLPDLPHLHRLQRARRPGAGPPGHRARSARCETAQSVHGHHRLRFPARCPVATRGPLTERRGTGRALLFRDEVPATLWPGHGQGCRGHRLLRLQPARCTE